MKPIQTNYNGYYFRSRLEARWAVFFDELGVDYEYESEGVELHYNGNYLPDFYLPVFQCYIEVKPNATENVNTAKPVELAISANKCVIVLFGDPFEYDFMIIKNELFHFSRFYEKKYIDFMGEELDMVDENPHRNEAISARQARFEFNENPSEENLIDKMVEFMFAQLKSEKIDFGKDLLADDTARFIKDLYFDYIFKGNLSDSQAVHLKRLYNKLSKKCAIPKLTEVF